ncbi:MAG: aminopeptidase, partial [Oscillospiraceae bacterium]|nr:aminopeptidase [Oscillospiraceae bacterium]
MDNKTQGQLLEEQLLMKKQNGAEILSDEEIAKADAFCEGYKKFLKYAKTERGAVTETVKILKQHGYEELDPDKKYEAGDKVYQINRGKAICFATIGTRPIKEGVRMVASHIDSPRLDLKPNP